MTVGSKKHLNKGKIVVWKALGMVYKFILNLGKEMKHKKNELEEHGESRASGNPER